MMNYCPVCKSPLVWLSGDSDSDGMNIYVFNDSECQECGLQVHETETYARTEVTAEFTFKEVK